MFFPNSNLETPRCQKLLLHPLLFQLIQRNPMFNNSVRNPGVFHWNILRRLLSLQATAKFHSQMTCWARKLGRDAWSGFARRFPDLPEWQVTHTLHRRVCKISFLISTIDRSERCTSHWLQACYLLERFPSWPENWSLWLLQSIFSSPCLVLFG